MFGRTKPVETDEIDRRIKETRETLLGLGQSLEKVRERVGSVEEDLHRLERMMGAFMEEAEERIDRGNKIWRRIRRAEQSEASLEDELEDVEEPTPLQDPRQLRLFDEGGGDPRGLPFMRGAMGGGAADPSWEEKKRALNRQLAGME